MKEPCIHCGVVNSHHPNCIVAVVQARNDRDAARETGAPIARESSTKQFVAVDRAVMRGQEHICTAVSHTFARRIARALNNHTPNSRGV